MRKYLLALVIVYMLFVGFVLMLGLIHATTDPAQQVRDGFRNARAACAAGMDRTPREHQLCKELME